MAIVVVCLVPAAGCADPKTRITMPDNPSTGPTGPMLYPDASQPQVTETPPPSTEPGGKGARQK